MTDNINALELEQISSSLMEYLRAHVVAPQVEFDEKTSLAGLGLDSVNYVEVLLYIERVFGIVVPSDQLDASRFESVHSLSLFLTRYSPKTEHNKVNE